MSRRCYVHKGVLIPGCMGAAVYNDRSRCTCPPPAPKPERLDRLEERIEELEREMADMRQTR